VAVALNLCAQLLWLPAFIVLDARFRYRNEVWVDNEIGLDDDDDDDDDDKYDSLLMFFW
jgi:hypothetical protein